MVVLGGVGGAVMVDFTWASVNEKLDVYLRRK